MSLPRFIGLSTDDLAAVGETLLLWSSAEASLASAIMRLATPLGLPPTPLASRMSRELSYRRKVELLKEAVGDGERGGALRYDAEELMATFHAWRRERNTLAHGFASFDWDGPLAELLNRPVIANMTKLGR